MIHHVRPSAFARRLDWRARQEACSTCFRTGLATGVPGRFKVNRTPTVQSLLNSQGAQGYVHSRGAPDVWPRDSATSLTNRHGCRAESPRVRNLLARRFRRFTGSCQPGLGRSPAIRTPGRPRSQTSCFSGRTDEMGDFGHNTWLQPARLYQAFDALADSHPNVLSLTWAV
jgi:hypothetical protein